MKYIKYIIPMLIIFLTIGFAATNVTLSITGDTYIASDLEDFDIYFSDIYINGTQDFSLLTSATSFEVTTGTKLGSDTVSFEIVNNSSKFDASITIDCYNKDNVGSHIVTEHDFQNPVIINSKNYISGEIVAAQEVADLIEGTLICSIIATPIERTEYGEGTVDSSMIQKYAILKSTNSSDVTAFRSSTYKDKIKTITFEKYPETDNTTYLENWDIGVPQYGSINAYITTNSADSNYYDLYIRSNSIMYANQDMSYWFSGFENLENIKGLDLLKTNFTTNMSFMFYESSSLSSLDLSSFNSSNVTNMNSMFSGCSSLTAIYVSDEWSTTNVTTSNSLNMFYDNSNLVGGAGTTYNSNKVNKEYARIDDGPNSSTPGYLTSINQQVGKVTTKPNDATLEYTGANQNLISTLTGTGTMYYRVNSGSWSTSIPTASAIGTYVVEYYAAANKNYTKSEIGKVTINIVKYTHTVTLTLVNPNGVALSNVGMTLRQRLVGKDPVVIATATSDSSGVVVFDNLRLSGGYILDCEPVDTSTYNWNFGTNNRVRSVSYTSGDITILTITSAASTLGTWQDAQINSVTPNINITMNCVLYKVLTQSTNNVLSSQYKTPSFLRNSRDRTLINSIVSLNDIVNYNSKSNLIIKF